MNIDPSKVIGNGSYGFVVLVGEYSCTNVHPEKRLNIDECTEVLEWLKKVLIKDRRVEVDLFEPMIDKTQVNVVKPVGFDGTTERLQLALQNEGLWDGEINAGFHNDYAFDINVVPYKNETIGQLKKYPFLQLTGFSIDMILSMFTERLTTIINERSLSQSDALWSTLLQMWKLSEETPFVHYRYRLGNNLTRVPLFRDSNLQQTIINRYAELHEVYDWFFRIMEGISVDKVVNKKALGILKSHLEHYFGCPNYFLFARVRSDPERLWIQIPTLEGEEGLTMHRDTLAFANVTAKQNDIDPARDDLQIVPQYYLHFVVERISMTLESQEKSLLEVVSEKNNETPMSIKDRF
ncbi:unnamed protein product, partial [Mesorhabditis belari]|uniref:Uncharacterized protein n=1 Tax=Mesorhabditis belari TaxID=2138241 RepID=A0AAF3J5F5_9BILA